MGRASGQVRHAAAWISICEDARLHLDAEGIAAFVAQHPARAREQHLPTHRARRCDQSSRAVACGRRLRDKQGASADDNARTNVALRQSSGLPCTEPMSVPSALTTSSYAPHCCQSMRSVQPSAISFHVECVGNLRHQNTPSARISTVNVPPDQLRSYTPSLTIRTRAGIRVPRCIKSSHPVLDPTPTNRNPRRVLLVPVLVIRGLRHAYDEYRSRDQSRIRALAWARASPLATPRRRHTDRTCACTTAA